MINDNDITRPHRTTVLPQPIFEIGWVALRRFLLWGSRNPFQDAGFRAALVRVGNWRGDVNLGTRQLINRNGRDFLRRYRSLMGQTLRRCAAVAASSPPTPMRLDVVPV